MVKITSITALLAAATAATTAAAATTAPLLPGSSEVADATSQGLRLVKTSDEDPGTWMTEEEKFEKLISKKIGFMDITDTLVSVFFFLASFVLVSPPLPTLCCLWKTVLYLHLGILATTQVAHLRIPRLGRFTYIPNFFY